MAKYQVEITDGVGIEIDIAPGAPTLQTVMLEWFAESQLKLRELVERCGGPAAFRFDAQAGSARRDALPMTRDGERAGTCSLVIWAASGLQSRPAVRFPAIAELALEANAAREETLKG